jgi:protein phosphatase
MSTSELILNLPWLPITGGLLVLAAGLFLLTRARRRRPKLPLPPPPLPDGGESGLGSPVSLAPWTEKTRPALTRVEATAVEPSLDLRSGRRSDPGRRRSHNEDSLLALERTCIRRSVCHPLGLYAIADGMGGHAAGDVASGLIVESLGRQAAAGLFTPPEDEQQGQADWAAWLAAAIQAANLALIERRRQAENDMGSTLVAALVEGSTAHIAHVGDSRAYLVNPAGIQRLTSDHSLVQRLVDARQITEEQARLHPQRNVVYRTMGVNSDLEVDTRQVRLAPGDRLLLCSDGLSTMVEDAGLHEIVQGAASPQAACEALIQAANLAGGTDNISAVVVELVPY